eukprot:275535-Hanusia_phi.AAC.1
MTLRAQEAGGTGSENKGPNSGENCEKKEEEGKREGVSGADSTGEGSGGEKEESQKEGGDS